MDAPAIPGGTQKVRDARAASNTVDAPPDWVPTEVHDWEGNERDCLVLNYTMACALSCDFCCYGCHPGRTEKMPVELAQSLVMQASEMSNFSCVGFTGGEPMLFADELLGVAASCARAGLTLTIATACHWASDRKVARRLLAEFRTRGLVRLNVSHDPSHAAFVPRENVLRAAEAASELEIPTYIVGTFFEAADSLETYAPELIDMPYVRLISKYVAKVGRASKAPITPSTYGLQIELGDLACYRRIHHDLVVFWDGATYPCCSTFNRATKGLVIGNANDDRLRTLWERAEGSLMYRVMKRQGFARFYEIIRAIDPELAALLPEPAEAVGPCSLCNRIFKSSEVAQRVKEVFAQYEHERISALFETLPALIGPDVAELVVADMADALAS